MTTTNPVLQKDTLAAVWTREETRMRRTYIATREGLAPCLVKHRSEPPNIEPEDLRRAQVGFGIPLNKSYIDGLTGHIQGATATYSWGKLSTDGSPISEGPADGVAKYLWDDATTDGVSWSNLFGGKVLEWLLTSPGGWLVCDTNKTAETAAASALNADGLPVRPFVRFAPWSTVERIGIGRYGVQWIQFAETMNERKWDDVGVAAKDYHVVFALEGRTTMFRRFDEDGVIVGEPVDMGEVLDTMGRPMLPLVPVGLGEHPKLPWIGAGYLLGLDDIVIDIFNLWSEARAGYRDACFPLLVYSGDDEQSFLNQLASGSQAICVRPNETVDRIGADSVEIDAGLSLIADAIKAWAYRAQQQAEAVASAQKSSGIALQADFALGTRPLLVNATMKLDEIETGTMYVLAQLAGLKVADAGACKVERAKAFRQEDEASRIARIVKEFVDSFGDILPAEVKARQAMRAIAASDTVDMAEDVEGRPLSEVAEEALMEKLTTPDTKPEPKAEAPAVGGSAPSPAEGKDALAA